MEEQPSPRIERLKTVLNRTGFSRSTLYLRMANGEFPRQLSLGGRSVGWLSSDVTEWIRNQKEVSNG